MRNATKLHWTCLVSTVGMALGASACGKKKSAADTTTSTQSVSPTGGVTPVSGNTVTLSGTLALSALGLADAPTAIYAFNLIGGSSSGNPTNVTVNADGTFSVPVTKADAGVAAAKVQLATPPATRDWDALWAAVKGFVPPGTTEAQLKTMQEADLQSGFAGLVKQLATSGDITMLVAYVPSPTGDKVAEAESFRFIGLPTADGGSLSALPNSDLNGDVALGSITGSGADVSGTVNAGIAINESDGALNSLKDASKALKMIKNAYMNSDWEVQPFYFWAGDEAPTALIGAYSDVTKAKYQGYGFYVKSNGDPGVAMSALCASTTALTFTPPSPITVLNSTGPSGGAATTSVTEFANTSMVTSTQNGIPVCFGDGIYVRYDMSGATVNDVELNFGAGGGITSTPAGLWKLDVGGTEKGRYDLDIASPVDASNNPRVFMPSIKFTKDAAGANIVGASVQFYHWNGTAYDLITDLSAIKRLASGLSASIADSSGNDIRSDMTINADGTVTTAFDSSQTDGSGSSTAVNPPVAVSAVTGFGMAYQIGQMNYRTEWRAAHP